jgi:hypothetical protein
MKNKKGRQKLVFTLFVIDTRTGAVKWVGNDEGRPFESIKGR